MSELGLENVQESAPPPATAEAEKAYTEEIRELDKEKERLAGLPSEEEIRLRLLTLKVKQLRHVLRARKSYAKKIYNVVGLWLAFVAVIVLLQAWGVFKLSDKVLLTLIGGATVNVLGIFAIVANFLFPKGGIPEFEIAKDGKARAKAKAKAAKAIAEAKRQS